MRTTVFSLFLTVLLLSLCACVSGQTPSPQDPAAVSAVSSMHFGPPDYTTMEYDADGRLIRLNNHRGSDDYISSYYIFEYDGDRLIRETQYSDPDHISDYTEYKYDAECRLLEIYHYDTYFGSSFVIEHDVNGNPIRTTSYKKDGSIRSVSEDEYDSRGNHIRTSLYLGDGSHDATRIVEYNDADQCICIAEYTADGSLFAYEIHEYDGEKRVRSIRYLADGTKISDTKYED